MNKPATNPDDFEAAVESYLNDCSLSGKTPMLQEFALDMRQAPATYSHWMADSWMAKGEVHRRLGNACKRLKLASEVALLNRVSDSARPVGSMFLLKCNHGYIEEANRQSAKNIEALAAIVTGVPLGLAQADKGELSYDHYLEQMQGEQD